jgi:hypothetical protein
MTIAILGTVVEISRGGPDPAYVIIEREDETTFILQGLTQEECYFFGKNYKTRMFRVCAIDPRAGPSRNTTTVSDHC